jgi:hypothetical protein
MERNGYFVVQCLFRQKPETGRPLGRPRHKWVLLRRMGCQVIGSEYLNRILLAQGRISWVFHVNSLISLEFDKRWVPS